MHLAAQQVPFFRSYPVLGAQVNLVCTFNLFEAARQANLKHITYASSIAVYGPTDTYSCGQIAADSSFDPRALFGVYKQANEGTAQIFWQDHGVSSIALRPYTVYGVTRDQGITSEPTKAMLYAAAGRDSTIGFGGTACTSAGALSGGRGPGDIAWQIPRDWLARVPRPMYRWPDSLTR